MTDQSYKEYLRERLLKDYKLHKAVYHRGYLCGIYDGQIGDNPYLGEPQYSVLADRWEAGRVDGLKDLASFDSDPDAT